ncbi:MAG: AAC(3) family N-acetyltransferase [Bacteriovorax sp.]|nr:AAC(3) family N-acetyltransferase [Bacteriovorax sp.]
MTNLNVDKKNFLNEVAIAVEALIGHDNRPVVAFSSAWPFLNELEQKNAAGVEQLLDVILEVVGKRNFLMPTFTKGFTDGISNLDTESSTTGVISECFRKRPGVRRSLSAFFSFAIIGPASEDVFNLRSEHAWGKNSVYEWMENNDACFLMLGTHPTHCSYLHRLELLAKERINYRFDKTFSGKIIREGSSFDIQETLYVRKLDPPVVNDFTVLLPHLYEAGMQKITINGVSLASYHTKDLLKTILPIMLEDPFFTVKNRKDYEVIL